MSVHIMALYACLHVWLPLTGWVGTVQTMKGIKEDPKFKGFIDLMEAGKVADGMAYLQVRPQPYPRQPLLLHHNICTALNMRLWHKVACYHGLLISSSLLRGNIHASEHTFLPDVLAGWQDTCRHTTHWGSTAGEQPHVSSSRHCSRRSSRGSGRSRQRWLQQQG